MPQHATQTCAESADKPIIHECITERAEKYIWV